MSASPSPRHCRRSADSSVFGCTIIGLEKQWELSCPGCLPLFCCGCEVKKPGVCASLRLLMRSGNRMRNEKKCLIYCPIFRDELRAVLGHVDNLVTMELGYEVHSHPDRMLKELKEGIQESQRKGMTFSILTGRDCECDVSIGDDSSYLGPNRSSVSGRCIRQAGSAASRARKYTPAPGRIR